MYLNNTFGNIKKEDAGNENRTRIMEKTEKRRKTTQMKKM
jgi:hypothetical protein